MIFLPVSIPELSSYILCLMLGLLELVEHVLLKSNSVENGHFFLFESKLRNVLRVL